MKDYYDTPLNECPVCGYKMDCASPVNGQKKPECGDFTICMSCSSVLKFDEIMAYKPANEEDLENIRKEDPESWEVMQKLIRIIKETIIDKGIKLYGND